MWKQVDAWKHGGCFREELEQRNCVAFAFFPMHLLLAIIRNFDFDFDQEVRLLGRN